jgi:terminal uridylyltransferase
MTDAVAALEAVLNGFPVHLFGSRATGFGEPGSDVDLTIEAPWAESGPFLEDLVQRLPKSFHVQEVALRARVPVVRIEYTAAWPPVVCDVTVNNLLPLHNTRLLQAYVRIVPNVVAVYHSVKHWAKSVYLLGAKDGCLSSYSWTLLVIFYLQVAYGVPSLQADVEPLYWNEYNVAFQPPVPLEGE